jgi:hypothetical protein
MSAGTHSLADGSSRRPHCRPSIGARSTTFGANRHRDDLDSFVPRHLTGAKRSEVVRCDLSGFITEGHLPTWRFHVKHLDLAWHSSSRVPEADRACRAPPPAVCCDSTSLLSQTALQAKIPRDVAGSVGALEDVYGGQVLMLGASHTAQWLRAATLHS